MVNFEFFFFKVVGREGYQMAWEDSTHLFFCEEKFQINIEKWGFFLKFFLKKEFGVPNCIPYGSFMFSPSAQQSLIMFPICSPRSQ